MQTGVSLASSSISAVSIGTKHQKPLSVDPIQSVPKRSANAYKKSEAHVKATISFQLFPAFGGIVRSTTFFCIPWPAKNSVANMQTDGGIILILGFLSSFAYEAVLRNLGNQALIITTATILLLLMRGTETVVGTSLQTAIARTP